MKESIPNILSLIYQERIERLCQNLSRIGGFKYFVSYIVFNNGQTFVLSNMFHMLTAYYTEKLYKEDFSFRKETTVDHTYFLCNHALSITDHFRDILEQRFQIYRTYYIVRNSPECQFIFGAIKNTPFDNFEWLYKTTLSKFEDFCCDFIDGVLDVIKIYNPSYYSAAILNDAAYRRRVIKAGLVPHEKLTSRELDCLYLAANGKSSEETAKILNISKLTVDGYRSEIKRKLNVANIAQAVFEAVKLGYIGAFSKVWQQQDPISETKIVISKSSQDIMNQQKAKNNNLWLLNKDLLIIRQPS